MTESRHVTAVHEVRDEYVDTKRSPASTAVQVAALFRPELLLEVEALVLAPETAQ